LIAIGRRTIHVACLPALLGAGALACSGRAVPVDVRASLGDSAPLAEVEIVALPYDPERLLDSLAAAYPVPRPDFSALEAELREFRRPAVVEEDGAVRALEATRDSVRRLADSLRRVDRRAPGYAAAYGRFRQLYRRLMERSGARDVALRSLTADVRNLAERAGRAADSLRAWEREAYAGFDSVAAGAEAAAGRSGVSAHTGGDGWGRLRLPPGAWYLVLAVPDPENAFLEYAWDVSVTVAGFPIRVPLGEDNARRRWRH
jgi:hypothetical protein